MNDDASLLHRYAVEGAQDAFAELVRRHLGLVYHAALRQTGGDPHRAQEVAQIVFTDLAHKASDLARRPHLVAWLHTGVRLAAAHLHRTEARRQAREHAAFVMNADEAGSTPEAAADWERLRPLIDDALQSLGERDRAAVLLRFFENRSYAELASALSVTEDAARVRTNRALEKLRSALARRGLVSTSSALALALVQPALAATPPGLAAGITSASLAAASVATTSVATGAAASATTGTLAATAVMSTAKIAATTVAAGLVVFSLGVAVLPTPAGTKSATPSSASSGLSAAELAAILHPARLSEAEAADALAAYLALPPLAEKAPETETSARAHILRRLLVVLPPDWFHRLLDGTAARPGGPEARLRRLAFTAWTELDAPVAARWIVARAPGTGIDAKARQNLATMATLAWAAADFDSAYEWAGTLSDLRDPLSRALLTRLADTAPERALELAQARGDAFFLSIRLDLFAAWSKRNPGPAIRSLGAAIFEPGKNADNYQLAQALARWSRAEPVAALDWLFAQSHQSREDNQELLRRMVGQAAHEDAPATLANALHQHPGLVNPADTLRWLLNKWVATDSRAALAWLDTLPDADERMSLATEALRIWSDPKTNLPLALYLPAGPGRAHAVNRILERWMKVSPDAALAWVRDRKEPDLSGLAAPLEASRLGDTARDTPAAAVSAWKNLPAGPAKTTAAAAIASAWGERDPAAAAKWWLAQQSSDLDTARISRPYARDQTLTPLLAGWSRRDPDSFLAWAEQQSASDLRDHALYTIIEDFDYEGVDAPSGRATAERIVRISDKYPNLMLLENHLRRWSRRNPAAAREWVSTNDAISPERAAQLFVHMIPVSP